MNTALTFSVDGIPRPQPRPRFVKGRVISTADANAKRWIHSVEAIASQAKPFASEMGEAVSVVLIFRFPTKDKSRLGKPHTHRPDSDNLAKLILDCLMRAGVIGDDSAVSSLSVRKLWANKPGVDVLLLPDIGFADKPIQPPAPDWLGMGGVAGQGRFN